VRLRSILRIKDIQIKLGQADRRTFGLAHSWMDVEEMARGCRGSIYSNLTTCQFNSSVCAARETLTVPLSV
jgi:hypothetical protein